MNSKQNAMKKLTALVICVCVAISSAFAQFISTLLKEPFDYTQWSRKHYEDVGLHEFNMRAVEYDRKNPVQQTPGI